MEQKSYEIAYSYTLDLITWTCPRCGADNSKNGDNLYDLDCDNCGYVREETVLDNQDTTDESILANYDDEEE